MKKSLFIIAIIVFIVSCKKDPPLEKSPTQQEIQKEFDGYGLDSLLVGH